VLFKWYASNYHIKFETWKAGNDCHRGIEPALPPTSAV
jgi:hypothetical protein